MRETLIKCDRCGTRLGELLKEEADYHYILALQHFKVDVDLCTECWEGLHKWWLGQ